MHKLELFFKNAQYEAGCDEAGRGCLAGPVFAAAVILPHNTIIEDLDDSKKISPKLRAALAIRIKKEALAYCVKSVSPNKIDEINILNASILAMHEAIRGLQVVPHHLIIDGNRFKPYENIPYNTIIKGDSKFQSIAAASILAKTERDIYMEHLDVDFPQYNWKKNKGYPSLEHKLAIIKLGSTIHHRKTFRFELTEKQKKQFG